MLQYVPDAMVPKTTARQNVVAMFVRRTLFTNLEGLDQRMIKTPSVNHPDPDNEHTTADDDHARRARRALTKRCRKKRT